MQPDAAGLPPRHALVWPDAAGRGRLATEAPAPLRAWIAAGRPLVRRRVGPGEAAEGCPVAATLPADPADRTGPARRRFAILLRSGEIARWAPPPTLRDLCRVGTLPAAWHGTAEALLRLGEATGVEPRVFGGAMWQHLAGTAMLHPGSDLDLLWAVTADTVLPVLLSGLHRLAEGTPRLDGEILFGPAGVQWRELLEAGPNDAVLVKDAAGIRLQPAGALRPAAPA